MREIKFKAFYKYQNKIVDVLSIDFINKRVYIESTKKGKPFGYINFDDCVLMQYTGLKDKNGTEIFEGDILKSSKTLIKYIVEFKDSQFMAITKSKRGNMNSFNWIDSEIIGNIYENSELLK